jgi:hypothetical protein
MAAGMRQVTVAFACLHWRHELQRMEREAKARGMAWDRLWFVAGT